MRRVSKGYVGITGIFMKINSIAISKKKGTRKTQVEEATLIEDHGLEGDAHAQSI